MKKSREELKEKFVTGAKPQEKDYHDAMDSYVHKDELAEAVEAMDLKGEKGDDAMNPFKGWFDEAHVPRSGAEGDYCYVTAGSETTVWRWDETEGAYRNTEEEIDSGSVQTFVGSEAVNEVAIDDSGLENPVNRRDGSKPVLAKASDVMQLKGALGGVTFEEEKENTSSDITGKYIRCDSTGGGKPFTPSSNASSYAYRVIDVSGYKRARFLGMEHASGTTRYGGFAFYDATNDGTQEDGTGLMSYTLYPNGSGSSAVEKEFQVDIPAEAKWLFVTSKNANIQNFYCYLQRGETVMEKMAQVEHSLGARVLQVKDTVDGYNESTYVDAGATSRGIWWAGASRQDFVLGKYYDGAEHDGETLSIERISINASTIHSMFYTGEISSPQPIQVSKGDTYKVYTNKSRASSSYYTRGVVLLDEDYRCIAFLKHVGTVPSTNIVEAYVTLDTDGHLQLDSENFSMINNLDSMTFDSLLMYVTCADMRDGYGTSGHVGYVQKEQETHHKGLTENLDGLSGRVSTLEQGDKETSNNSASYPHPVADCSQAVKELRDGGREYYLATPGTFTDTRPDNTTFTRVRGNGGEIGFEHKGVVNYGYLDKIIASLPQGRHFIAFADCHLDYSFNTAAGYSTRNFGILQAQHEVMRYCYEALGGCKVVFLGDFCGPQPEHVMMGMYDWFARTYYGLFGSDFVYVIGAHEEQIGTLGGGATDIIPEDVTYSRLFAPALRYGAVFDEVAMQAAREASLTSNTLNKYWEARAGMAFYTDDARLKARIISFSSDVSGKYVKWGFNAAICHVHFVCKALETIPDDYIAILCFHNEGQLADDNTKYVQMYRSGIKRIFQAVTAFKSQQTFTLTQPAKDTAEAHNSDTYTMADAYAIWDKITEKYDSMTFDYSGKSGKVVMLRGHYHFDAAEYVDVGTYKDEKKQAYNGYHPGGASVVANSPLLVTVDRSILSYGESYASHLGWGRRRAKPHNAATNYLLGTTDEVLFDIVTLTDDNKIVFTRVGNYLRCGSDTQCANFDATKTYAVGDEVVNWSSADNQLHKYTFNTQHTGTWDDSHVDMSDDVELYEREYDLNRQPLNVTASSI